jgi:hypothetical protein
MITLLINLCASKGQVNVDAQNDATPVDETFTFKVGPQTVVVGPAHFDANDFKTVTGAHGQGGVQFVSVSTQPSGKSKSGRLDIDAGQCC